MTVIIKELVVKTAVIENRLEQKSNHESNLKKSIMKDCLQKINRTSKKRRER